MSFLADATINHFSHPHPLHLFNHPDHLTSASCSGCKLEATGMIYTCFNCNYFLHINCSKLPQQITHPCDKDHVFTLLSKPLYAEGLFECDACMSKGDGFSYHCKICKIDLHILCAVGPLIIRHQSHMDHQLNLIFSPPYPNKVFNCDVCNTAGFDHWLYRCEVCSFDVHLECKNVPVSRKRKAYFHQQSQAEMQQLGTTSRSPILEAPQSPNYQGFRPQLTATGIPLQTFMLSVTNLNQATHAAPVLPFGQRQNINLDGLLAPQLLFQGLPNNSSQNIYSQYFLQTLAAGGGTGSGGVGSGVGADLAGLQQLYQLFSGIHAGGVGGDLAGRQQLYQLFSGISAGGVGGLGGGRVGGGFGGDPGGMQQLYQSFSGITAGAGSGGVPAGLNLLGSVGGGGEMNMLQALMGGVGNGLNTFGGDGGSSILGGGLDALMGLLGGFSL